MSATETDRMSGCQAADAVRNLIFGRRGRMRRNVIPARPLSTIFALLAAAGLSAGAQAQTNTITPMEIYEGETLEFAITFPTARGYNAGEGYGYVEPATSTATEGSSNDWHLADADGNRIARLTQATHPVVTENGIDTVTFLLHARTDSVTEGDETIRLLEQDYSGPDRYVTITLKDGPRPVVSNDGVTLSESALTLEELHATNAEKTYTVVLDTDPGADVRITATVPTANRSEVMVSSIPAFFQSYAELHFTHGDAGNWNTAQTVTVKARNDANATDTASFNITHELTVANGPYASITPDPVAVTVTDAGHGVTVSESSVTMAEDSDTADYTIVLKSQPGSSVVITPASSVPANATVSGALTFPTNWWHRPQTVTVTGASAGSTTISHMVTTMATGYPTSTTIASVMVTVTAVANNAPTVDNAIPDQTATAGTAFSYAFAANTFADVDGDDLTYTAVKSDGTALPDWLSFNSGTRAFTGTPQAADVGTLSVKVTADDGNSGTVDDTFDIVVSHPARNLDIQVADAYEGENIVLTLTLSRAPGNVVAGQRTFRVETDVPSASNVNTCITSHGCEAGSTPVAAADFTATNTDVVFGANETVKTVSIPIATDSVSEGVEVALINITYNPPGMGDLGIFTSGSTQITGRNAFDGAPLVFSDNILITSYGQILGDSRPAPVTITEGGGTTVSEDGSTTTDSYTVVLNSAPSAGVTVTATAGAGAQVQGPGGTAGGTATLAFTTSNWSQAQTVTVTGVDDDIDNTGDARTVTIAHVASSTDPTYSIANAGEVSVTVTDDDTAGLVFSPDPVSVGEGDTGSYTVKLASEPTASVTVTITGQGGATDLTLDTDSVMAGDQNTLTFTSGNWSAAQTVNLTAAEDVDISSDTVTLSHAPSGGGYGSAQDRDLEVTITDNDSAPELTFGAAAYDGAEDSGTIDVTVNADTAPTAALTVSLATANGSATGGTDFTAPGATFPFPSGVTSHTVSVAVTDDSFLEDDETFMLTLSDATGYTVGTQASTTVTITDQDTVTVELNAPSHAVLEGAGTVSVSASITSTPVSANIPISLTLTSADGTATGASGGTGDGIDYDSDAVTITIGAGANGATGTIAIRDDTDQEVDETFALTLSTSQTRVSVGTRSASTVTIADNDRAKGLVFTPSAVTVGEGASATYTVHPTTLPTSNVTVSVIVPGGSDLSIDTDNVMAGDQNTLTFTTSDWHIGQPVKVTAAQDDDTANDLVSLTHAPSGGGYTGPHNASLQITITDDDTTVPAVSVSLPTGGGEMRTDDDEQIHDESEGGVGAAFTVRADRALAGTLTACVRITESDADRVASADEGIKTVSLTSTGSADGAGIHTLTWTDTAADDRDSRVTVQVVAPNTPSCTANNGTYTVATSNSSDKLLIKDDESTEVSLTAGSDTSMAEGDASDTAALTVGLSRRLYAGEIIVVPLTLTSGTGARLPGSTDGGSVANHDFTVSAAAASGQTGAGIANAATATPTLTFTGSDSGTVQNATLTLTPVANRDDDDTTPETITATLATDSVLGATETGTTVSGAAQRHSSDYAASVTMTDDEADTTAPTVTSITRLSPTTSPTNEDTLTWQVTFSEAVVNVDAAAFQVSNTNATLAVSAVSGTTYDVQASGGDLAGLNATVTLSFNSSHNIEDANGNDLASNPAPPGTNDNDFVVDNTAPTVTIEIPATGGTITGAVTATFTFDETVTGFESGDIAVTNAAVSGFAVDTAGTVWTAAITPDANGTPVTVNVTAGAADDLAGNASAAAAQANVNYTVALGAPGLSANPGDSQVTLSWSTPTGSAGTAAVQKYQYRYQAGSSVTAGSWTDVADGPDDGIDAGDETTVTVTGLTNGTQYAFALRAVNAAGNGDAASATATPESSDTTAPQVASITRQSPSTSPTSADELTWRVTFSEAVVNVDATDFQRTSTTASLSVTAVSGATYDVKVSGGDLAGLDATVTLSFNASHDIDDANGNDLASNPTPTGADDNDFVVDNTAPAVTIEIPATGGTITGAVTTTFTFDETVTGFDASDIAVTNSAVSGFAVDTAGTVWTATITPNVNGTPVTVNVTAGAADDLAGNASAAATQASVNYTVTLGAPAGFTATPGDTQVSLSWSAPAGSGGTAAAQKYQYRHQAGSGVTAGSWTDVADGPDDGIDAGDETTVTVTGLTNGTQYAFALRAVNAAGNGDAAAATATPSSSDTTAPKVVSITRRSPTTSPTSADTLTWRVIFDEAVVNVDASDFQRTGTTASLSVTAVSGTTYDVQASGGDLAGLDGTVTLSFNSGHDIEDASSNALAANPTPTGTDDNDFVVDNTAPTVTIEIPATGGTIMGAATATFTFDEAVTGFESGDIAVTNAAVSGFAADTAGTVWTATITPDVNGTPVTVNVTAGAADDLAGNANSAATQASVNYTITLGAPAGFTATPGDTQVSLSWSAPAGSGGTAAAQKYQYRHQAGSGVTAGSWTDVADGPDDGIDAGDETTVTVTGLTNGTQYAFALRAVNAAGNGDAAAATATPSSSDTTAPKVVSITRRSPTTSPTSADTLTWRVIFDEAVVNVDASDFQVSNTTATPAVTAVSGTTYDVQASGGNLAGLNATVTLSFNSGHDIEDASSNALVPNPEPAGTNDNTFAVENIVVTITAGPAVTEGEAARFTLNADPAPGAALTVDVTVAQSGAFAAPGDIGAKRVTIAAGASSAAYEVATLGDTVDEAHGSVTVTVNTGTGYEAGTPSSATVAVRDDDETITPPRAPQITIDSPGVAEGGDGTTATIALNVTLSAAASAPVTVDYADSLEGSAASRDDYDALAAGTLTFAPGERRHTIAVKVIGDDIDEGDGETVIIRLSNPTGAQFAGSAATIDGTGTIRDDDRAGIRLSTSAVRIAEPGGTQSYKVFLTSDPDGTATVAVASADERVATVSPAVLTFNTVNWNEGLEVTVTAAGATGSSTRIRHDPSGDGGYDSAPGASVRVYAGESSAEGIETWIGRFGAALASQIRDTVRDRMSQAGPGPDTVTIAGQAMQLEAGAGRNGEYAARTGYGADPDSLMYPMDDEPEIRHLSNREAFGTSSFSIKGTGPGTRGGSVWGQASTAEFDGRDGADTVDGRLKSAIAGAEMRRPGWIAGASVSRAEADGGYVGENGLKVDFKSHLTAVTPYAGIDIGEGLRAWGALGFGRGRLHTTRDGAGEIETDLDWRMIAAGASRDLAAPGAAGGFSVSAFADAFAARTTSRQNAAIERIEADASQLRLGIGGRRSLTLSDGRAMAVELDAALRRDAGVGDDGTGIDIGGSVRWGVSDRIWAGAEGRALALHGVSGRTEVSAAMSMDYDRDRATLAGPSATLGVSTGTAQSAGYLHESAGLPATRRETDTDPAWNAEYAYGVEFGRSGLVRSHYLRSRWGGDGRSQALGIRLQPDSRNAPRFSLDAYVSNVRGGADSSADEVSGRVEATWRW